MADHRFWFFAIGLGLALTTGLPRSAEAQTGWTQGFTQGTVEASALARDGSRFGIYCAGGQVERNAGIVVEPPGRRSINQPLTVEAIVGDRHFVFASSGGLSIENTMSGKNQLLIMQEMLASGKNKLFRVRIPELNWQQQYTTAGARSALGSGKNDILADCMKP